MGEYKFKGIRIDTGEWVYGDLINCSYKTYIKDCTDKTTNPRQLTNTTADFRCVEVNSKTVSQYYEKSDFDEKKGEEFEKLKQPLKDFMNKYCCPHDTLIVQQGHMELLNGEMALPLKILD